MKNYIFPIYLCCTAMLWIACSAPVKPDRRITVSIEPQRYFVDCLVDTLFDVQALVPPGSSPENYDPDPQQMAQLARSQAYFLIGNIGFETVWKTRLQANNPQVRFFDNSADVIPIADDAHGQSADPHTWTSPKQARIIVQNMYQALLQLDSENQIHYRRNLEKLLAVIDTTDREVSDLLAQAPQKSFIIYHPALSYLARDYGLTQYAIEHDGKEPSPNHLKQLVDIAQAEHIRIIFIQEEFDRKNAEIIARETGCRLVTIQTLSYHWREEILRIARILSE